MTKYPFDKVLVTGGSGFIGSTYIEKLLKEYSNFEILNLDKISYASSLRTNELFTSYDNFSFLKTDIADRKALERVVLEFSPSLIINFAAESHVDNSILASEDFIRSNILGSYNLLEVAKKINDSNKNFMFHHISTDEVYGDLFFDETPFTEENQYKPSSPYSSSKASSDLLVMSWGRTYDIPFLITNCSNNYGPRQYLEKFIPKIISQLRNGEKVPVYGDGLNIRDWIYVEDHIDAIFSLHNEGCKNEVFNIGGNDEKSNIDLLNLILLEMSKLKFIPANFNGIEFIEDRKGHDLRYAIDSSKIKNVTGWEPSTKFDEGISKTILWYLENDTWWKN